MGFIPFTFVDFIDIILVASLLYAFYRAMRGTSAPYIMLGIFFIYLLWILVKTFNLVLFSTILGQIISVGVIAILIIFQPEIRKALEQLPKLDGCQVHSTVMLSEVDHKIFKKLGVGLTCDPVKKVD